MSDNSNNKNVDKNSVSPDKTFSDPFDINKEKDILKKTDGRNFVEEYIEIYQDIVSSCRMFINDLKRLSKIESDIERCQAVFGKIRTGELTYGDVMSFGINYRINAVKKILESIGIDKYDNIEIEDKSGKKKFDLKEFENITEELKEVFDSLYQDEMAVHGMEEYGAEELEEHKRHKEEDRGEETHEKDEVHEEELNDNELDDTVPEDNEEKLNRMLKYNMILELVNERNYNGPNGESIGKLIEFMNKIYDIYDRNARYVKDNLG